MDWIHCNVCYQQPSKEKAFSLTSCGHMFCNDCLGNDKIQDGCKVCQSKCSSIQLVQEMESEVKEFFSQPEDILSKLLQVLEFQKKHRMKLTAHWMTLNQKYAKAKTEIQRLRLVSGKLYKNLKELHKQNLLLKNSISTSNINNQLLLQTPIMSPPMQGPLCSVTKTTSQLASANTSTKIYNSKLVTPLRVNKHRNPNSSHYSAMKGYSVVQNVNTQQHAFLTPPNDTPPSALYKYVKS